MTFRRQISQYLFEVVLFCLNMYREEQLQITDGNLFYDFRGFWTYLTS